MACLHPFLRKIPGRTLDSGYYPVPCGRCLQCLIDRRVQWQDRLQFEMHDLAPQQCNFVRLSYSDDNLPPQGVDKKHIQDFLKRWRKHFPPNSLKYFIVAEYGDKGDPDGFHRPHYHCCFFGPWSRKSPPRYPTPYQMSYLSESWGHGYVDCRLLNSGRIRYILKYLDKQYTYKWHPTTDVPYWKSNNLNEPFLLCSKGIGANFITTHPGVFTEDGYYVSEGGIKRPLQDTTVINSV